MKMYPLILISLLLAFFSCSTLAQSKSHTKALKTLHQSKQADKRSNAANILKHADSLEAAQALAQALINDNDLNVRIAAAASLWGHTHAEQVQADLWQATEDAPEVAVRAAGALKSIGVAAEQLTTAFRKGLQANGVASQFNAARGLIGIDSPEVLLPYLLNHLQQQASKDNLSGIQAAGKAIAKMTELTGAEFYPTLLDGINSDQAGNYVVLSLFEHLPILTDMLLPYIIAASNSTHYVNRMAAGSLATRFATDDHAELSKAIAHLFQDKNEAVVETVTMACGQNNKHLLVCEEQLRGLLNSSNKELRTIAADALAGLSEYIKVPSDGLTDDLKDKALNGVSDDIRYDAIDAYISSNVSDELKSDLLADVALKETHAYIITFALSRLNRLQQHLNSEQKQQLASLKSHEDSEVKRIANLLF